MDDVTLAQELWLRWAERPADEVFEDLLQWFGLEELTQILVEHFENHRVDEIDKRLLAIHEDRTRERK